MFVRIVLVGTVVLSAIQFGQPAWCAEIAWRKDVSAAAREAAATNKPLLVMVEASWCGPCRRMLQQTFPDRAVTARINAGFIPLLIDADQQAALVQKLNINAFPTMLILDANLRVVERVTGFQSAAQMNARLAGLKLTPPRVGPPPVAVAQSAKPVPPPQAARAPSFHDRMWASIRNSPAPTGRENPVPAIYDSSVADVRPDASRAVAAPRPALYTPGYRDTYAAAIAFSSGH